MKKMPGRLLKFVFFIVFIGIIFACEQPPNLVPQTSETDEEDDRTRPTRSRSRSSRSSRSGRTSRDRSARTKRHSCRSYGDQSDYKCEGDEDCEDACQELFAIRKYENQCLELPAELVYAFEELLVLVDDGDADDIEPEVLDCLLEIDDKKFLKEVGGLNSKQTKSFLEEIATNDDLAEALSEHDESYNIMNTLLDKLGDPPKALADGVEGDITFLDLILDADNEPAFNWVDGYVNDICDDSNSECAYTVNSNTVHDVFVVYCKLYYGVYTSNTATQSWNILKESELFKENYEDNITDGADNDECDDPDGPSSNTCSYDNRDDWKEVCDEVYEVDSSSDGW